MSLTGAQRQARYRKRRKAAPHKAVADALSAFCDAIDVVTPEQVPEALDELELLGVCGDAELAIGWLKGFLDRSAAIVDGDVAGVELSA